jgi:hypothetical protein
LELTVMKMRGSHMAMQNRILCESQNNPFDQPGTLSVLLPNRSTTPFIQVHTSSIATLTSWVSISSASVAKPSQPANSLTKQTSSNVAAYCSTVHSTNSKPLSFPPLPAIQFAGSCHPANSTPV